MRINDRTVTLASFRQVGKLLINIYGQHDFQAISDKEHHLELLDSLGDKVFVQEKAKMAKDYQDLAVLNSKETVYSVRCGSAMNGWIFCGLNCRN